MMGDGGGRFSLDDVDEEEDIAGGGGGGRPNGRPLTAGAGVNEESAAWGDSRPRGMDGGGVIRL